MKTLRWQTLSISVYYIHRKYVEMYIPIINLTAYVDISHLVLGLYSFDSDCIKRPLFKYISRRVRNLESLIDQFEEQPTKN